MSKRISDEERIESYFIHAPELDAIGMFDRARTILKTRGILPLYGVKPRKSRAKQTFAVGTEGARP